MFNHANLFLNNTESTGDCDNIPEIGIDEIGTKTLIIPAN